MTYATANVPPFFGVVGAEFLLVPWALLGGATLVFMAVLVYQRKSLQAVIDTQEDRFAKDMDQANDKVAELQKQTGQARLASQTQSELLATLSREVRAHMDGIVGSANLLLETKLQPSQRMQLVTLRATGESLLYVLGDVQAICELETRTIKPVPAPLDLRTEFAQVIEVLSPRAALKNVELSLLIAPGVPRRVVADAGLLRQFFFNLSASALRFAESGGLILHIDTTAADPSAEANSVRLRFGASASKLAPGSGYRPNSRSPMMAEETMEHGMELAVTKRLVELMGGRFGVSGGRNEETDFWFELPLQVETTAVGYTPVVVRLPCFAVVFDDAAAARVAAAGLLDEMQIEHDLATTAAEALEALKLAVIDSPETVLLLDETLPEEELTQLGAGLASDPELRRVRVILMSMRPERAGLNFTVPVSAILQKPLLLPRDIQTAIEAARRTPVMQPPTAEPSLSRAPFASTEHAGARILLTEDDEISGQVIETMLKRLGCTVTLARDGFEAVGAVQEGAFDLILMDIRMPRLNGWDATKQILAKLGAGAPPIVAVTAEATATDRERAAEIGMRDFLSKPVSKADLVRTLQRWTGRPPGEPGSGSPPA